VWRQFRQRPLNLAALSVIVTLFAVAALADFLASDKPIAMRHRGELTLFPNLTDPPKLRATNNVLLRGALDRAAGDWLLEPPVPFGPYQTDITLPQLPSPPGEGHLMGTDETGRDVLARLIHGSRVSLAVGFIAVAIYVTIGVFLGALAGYRGGKVDLLVSRSIEIMLTFPTLFLILCIMAMIDRPSIFHIMAVIGLTRWPDVARLIRGEVLKVKEMDYVVASRALGASGLRIVVRHILPNAMGPALVAATFGVAGAILIESSLSFLGFGTPPPTASWGEILTQAHRYVTSPGAWWLTLFPGAAIFLTVTSYNLAGEGLRDALDPTLKE
jgi:peptide/nickel transport system permease protein